MGLPVLTGQARGEAARRLNKWSCLPLVVAMVGLIASATPQGNPSQAPYVFTGVGRSPARERGAIDRCVIDNAQEGGAVKVCDCSTARFTVKLTDHYPYLIEAAL